MFLLTLSGNTPLSGNFGTFSYHFCSGGYDWCFFLIFYKNEIWHSKLQILGYFSWNFYGSNTKAKLFFIFGYFCPFWFFSLIFWKNRYFFCHLWTERVNFIFFLGIFDKFRSSWVIKIVGCCCCMQLIVIIFCKLFVIYGLQP